MTVTITRDMVADVLKRVRQLTQSQVLIGVPDKNAERQPEPGEDSPITNAGIGYVMEFGSPARNIPPRPFLIPGIQTIKADVVKRLKVAGEKAMSGDHGDIDKELAKVGIIGQNAVRKKITDGPFEALSPRTLAERRLRGRTGTKPLIDTGQLRNSITYVVRKKSDE